MKSAPGTTAASRGHPATKTGAAGSPRRIVIGAPQWTTATDGVDATAISRVSDTVVCAKATIAVTASLAASCSSSASRRRTFSCWNVSTASSGLCPPTLATVESAPAVSTRSPRAVNLGGDARPSADAVCCGSRPRPRATDTAKRNPSCGKTWNDCLPVHREQNADRVARSEPSP